MLLINVHEVLKPNNGWPAVSPYLAGIAVVHIGLTLVSSLRTVSCGINPNRLAYPCVFLTSARNAYPLTDPCLSPRPSRL